MLEFVSDLGAEDLGMVVAVRGGWCRRCLSVLVWLPCGAAGALVGVLGIFLVFGVWWSGCGLFPLEALVFGGGGGFVGHFL